LAIHYHNIIIITHKRKAQSKNFYKVFGEHFNRPILSGGCGNSVVKKYPQLPVIYFYKYYVTSILIEYYIYDLKSEQNNVVLFNCLQNV